MVPQALSGVIPPGVPPSDNNAKFSDLVCRKTRCTGLSGAFLSSNILKTIVSSLGYLSAFDHPFKENSVGKNMWKTELQSEK